MRVVAIDLSAVYWTAWHASADEDVSGAYERTLRQVRDVARDHDACVVCLDSPKSKRREAFSDYKAHREKKPAGALEMLRRAIDELRGWGLLCLEAEGYEGDDVVAAVAEWAEARDHELTIYGADKDLYQLLSPSVTILNHQTHQRFGVDDLRAKADISPDQVPDFLALVGDKSDGLPGVDKCGAKKAARLLGRFHCLEGLYDALKNEVSAIHALPGVGPSLVGSLIEAGERSPSVFEVLQLATLDPPEGLRLDLIATSTLSVEDFDGTPEQPMNAPEDIHEQIHDAELVPDTEAPPSPRDTQPSSEPSSGTTASPGRSLARREVSYQRSLEPQSPKEAWHMATKLYQSGFFKVRNLEAVFTLIVAGRSYGLDVVQSVRGIHIIDGKPTLSAGLMHALCLRHPDCEYFSVVESTSTRCVCETKRRGAPRPQVAEWTIEEAQAAGLAGKDNWRKYPKAMLRSRCIAELARMAYPDALHGTYTPDELDADELEEVAA